MVLGVRFLFWKFLEWSLKIEAVWSVGVLVFL